MLDLVAITKLFREGGEGGCWRPPAFPSPVSGDAPDNFPLVHFILPPLRQSSTKD